MKVLMTYAAQTPHHDFPVMMWSEKYDMKRKWQNIIYVFIPL